MFIYKIYKTIYNFCDKLEDKVRGFFSHFPIIYAMIGGIGVVLFWRGVWHTVDYIMAQITAQTLNLSSTDLGLSLWWDGPLSFAIGTTILLMTGVFVSNFIGNEIIISGLKGEKKVAEKTEKEVKTEKTELQIIQEELDILSSKLTEIEKDVLIVENQNKNRAT